MEKFHIYVKFPLDLEKRIFSASDGEKFIKDLQIILDRADCEHGANLYFEESNKESFFDDLGAILPLVGYIGTLTIQEAIAILLNDSNATNWEDGPIHEIKEDGIPYYKEFNPANRNIEEKTPAVLKEITEKTIGIDPEREGCLLLQLLGNTSAKERSVIRVSKDNAPRFIHIETASSFKELETYLETNREKRKYNYNDNRHVEGHNDYRNGKSPLIGGLGGKPNAEALLQSALGDQQDRKFLINFDRNNKAYIRYESENFQYQYHGYHLVYPRIKPYARDMNAENDISPRIVAILKYRQENP